MLSSPVCRVSHDSALFFVTGRIRWCLQGETGGGKCAEAQAGKEENGSVAAHGKPDNDVIGLGETVDQGLEKMFGDIGMLFDQFHELVARKPFDGGLALGDDGGVARFAGDGAHLAEIIFGLGYLGYFFAVLDHHHRAADELEKILVHIALPDDNFPVLVSLDIRVDQIGGKAFLGDDRPFQHLLNGGDPFPDLLQPGHAQSFHAFLDGNFPQLILRDLGIDRLGNLIRYLQQLEETDPPLIAATVADRAADRIVNREVGQFFLLETDGDQLFRRRLLDQFLALGDRAFWPAAAKEPW